MFIWVATAYLRRSGCYGKGGLAHRATDGADGGITKPTRECPKMLNLSCCPLRRTGVVKYHIGPAALKVQGISCASPPANSAAFQPRAVARHRAPPAGHRQTPSLSHSLSHPASKINGASKTAKGPSAANVATCSASSRAISGMRQCSKLLLPQNRPSGPGRTRSVPSRAAVYVAVGAEAAGPEPAADRPPRRAATAGPRARRSASSTTAPRPANSPAARLLPLATPPVNR